MLFKTKQHAWGWGFRVDKKGGAHDSFVIEREKEKPVKTKWRVKPRGMAKLSTAAAK